MEENLESVVSKKKQYTHCSFQDIYEYLSTKSYPVHIKTKGDKSNFRRCTRNFAIIDNELKFKRHRRDGSTKEVGSIIMNLENFYLMQYFYSLIYFEVLVYSAVS